MAEAIVRVQRQAGEISRTIGAVGRETKQLVEQLEQIDARVAGATKTLEDYRRLVRRGVALNPQQAQSAMQAERFVREKAPEHLRSQGAPESLIEDLRRYADRSEAAAAVGAPRSNLVPPPRREPLPSSGGAGGRTLSSLSAHELEREERRLAREISRVERDVDRLVGDQTGSGGASLRQAALAADPARRDLLERKREVDARLASVRSRAAAADVSGALTDEEREDHRRLGTTDEQLDRARRLRPGTIIVPPAESRVAAALPPAAGTGADLGAGPGESPPSAQRPRPATDTGRAATPAAESSAPRDAEVSATRTKEAAEDVAIAVGGQRKGSRS